MNYLKSVRHIFLTLVSIIFLLVSVQAHADFRRALAALNSRDGEALFKEVKEAVDSKNDDGLHIFIMQLREQFMLKGFLSEGEKALEKTKKTNLYTLSTLFDKQQTIDFLQLINQLVEDSPKNNDYFESRAAMLFLNFKGANNINQQPDQYSAWGKAWRNLAIEATGKLTDRQTIELIAYTMFNSCEATFKERFECLKIAAELGDAHAQSDLGQFYLGQNDQREYNFSRGRLIPSSDLALIDKEKADYWLEQSVINAEFPNTTSAYCAIAKRYRYGDETHGVDLRQAYLLYLQNYLGGEAALRTESECGKEGLISMFNDGSLAKVAPEYISLWEHDNQAWVSLHKLAPPPKQSVKSIDTPIIVKAPKTNKRPYILFYRGHGGQFYLYPDGLLVFKRLFTLDKWHVPTSTINELLKEFSLQVFADTPVYSSSLGYDNDGYYEIYVDANHVKKTIHGEDASFSKKIYQFINTIIPNSYM